MTIDERLEFMTRNIESLHEAVFENTRQIAELDAKLGKRIGELAARQEKTDEMLQGLIQATAQMLRGWANHDRRIERLEGGVA